MGAWYGKQSHQINLPCLAETTEKKGLKEHCLHLPAQNGFNSQFIKWLLWVDVGKNKASRLCLYHLEQPNQQVFGFKWRLKVASAQWTFSLHTLNASNTCSWLPSGIINTSCLSHMWLGLSSVQCCVAGTIYRAKPGLWTHVLVS